MGSPEHFKTFGTLVKDELAKHGLTDAGWEYGYDNAKARLGKCDYNKKLITFSIPYVQLNSIENMYDTVLHEIAHALVGPRNNHNYVWRNKAYSIGAKARACNSNPLIIHPSGPYVMNCGCRIHYLYRKSTVGKSYTCVHCRRSATVTINKEYNYVG